MPIYMENAVPTLKHGLKRIGNQTIYFPLLFFHISAVIPAINNPFMVVIIYLVLQF